MTKYSDKLVAKIVKLIEAADTLDSLYEKLSNEHDIRLKKLSTYEHADKDIADVQNE